MSAFLSDLSPDRELLTVQFSIPMAIISLLPAAGVMA